jgi:hypothetical protein
MTITVVQATNPNGLFGSAITAGNTVILAGIAYNGGNDISSSVPTIGGTAVTGTLIESGNSPTPTSALVYQGMWMLPDVAGGGTQLGLTFSATGGASEQSLIGFEVSGLGPSPVADRSSEGSGINSGPAASGTTAAIQASPEIVIGASVGYALTVTAPGAPWTSVAGNSTFCYAGYQVVTSSGGTYQWSTAVSGAGDWTAGVVTVAASAGAPATAAQLPLVVSQAVKRAAFY